MSRKMRYLSERKSGDYRYVRDYPTKLLRAIPSHPAAVELGATWVPSFLKILDNTVRAFSRVQPALAAMSRKPSEQLTEQMGFTAFPFEDVGTSIEHSNAELYMFASDYPHIEGGRDPLGSFDSYLVAHSTNTHQKFFAENFRRVFRV